jgi:hypothetical protein
VLSAECAFECVTFDFSLLPTPPSLRTPVRAGLGNKSSVLAEKQSTKPAPTNKLRTPVRAGLGNKSSVLSEKQSTKPAPTNKLRTPVRAGLGNKSSVLSEKQ